MLVAAELELELVEAAAARPEAASRLEARIAALSAAVAAWYR
jgi:hypothetical protein